MEEFNAHREKAAKLGKATICATLFLFVYLVFVAVSKFAPWTFLIVLAADFILLWHLGVLKKSLSKCIMTWWSKRSLKMNIPI